MANVFGTAGNDFLVGTPDADDISGLAGDDILSGGAGDDVLRGGPGRDTQDGGPGFDIYVYDSVGDSPFQQNLVQNGSFELGPEPGFYLPLNPGSMDINGWEVTRGQIDYVGTDWVSSDGNRSLDLNGTPGVGGVAQTFATIPGQTYHVSFDLAGHYSGLIQYMEVNAAGQSQVFTLLSGTDPNNLGWKGQTWDFTATAPQTTLEFRSLQPDYPYGGPALDNVVVTGASGNSDYEQSDRIVSEPHLDPSGLTLGEPIALTMDANAEIAGLQAFTFMGTNAPADGQGAAKTWVADGFDPTDSSFKPITIVYASIDSDNTPEMAILVDDGAITAANWFDWFV
jgi:choice-of-anchor C domain-containing protein